MRVVVVVLFTAVVLGLSGCGSRTDELETRVVELQSERDALLQDLAMRDTFFEEVARAVSEVSKDLEESRSKEAQLMERAQATEGKMVFTSEEIRKDVLDQIAALSTRLKENKKRISDLQGRVKSARGEIAALTTMIEHLKTTVAQREQSIAEMEARIQGLETTVASRLQDVHARDSVIQQQSNQLNTALYVVGTRDELKEKGVIRDEGGFLWGLLGSTTVLAEEVDDAVFSRINKEHANTIHVGGSIEEIIPRRGVEYFSVRTSDGESALTITTPEKFWQQSYLVIVLD